MTQSVAVAIVHGIGRQREDFASAIIQQLRRCVAQKLGAETIPADAASAEIPDDAVMRNDPPDHQRDPPFRAC